MAAPVDPRLLRLVPPVRRLIVRAGVAQALRRTAGTPWAEMPIAAVINPILTAEWDGAGAQALIKPR